jgi:hypothetical protein
MSTPQSGSVPSLLAPNGSALRAADALLRLAGGRSVMLRLPASAVPSDPTEQLGLATPQFQDVPLGPVVFRKARPTGAPGKPPRWEMLVSASAVQAIVGSLGSSSAATLFAAAFGVLSDDELLEIVGATEQQLFGAPYCYRLVLRAPIAQML